MLLKTGWGRKVEVARGAELLSGGFARFRTITELTSSFALMITFVSFQTSIADILDVIKGFETGHGVVMASCVVKDNLFISVSVATVHHLVEEILG
jgi:hypothetical protein